MSFELITVSSREITQAQIAAVIALCSDVFEMDYSFYMNLDLYRVHVLGYDDGHLVSHALWLERPLRIGDGPWCNAAYIEGGGDARRCPAARSRLGRDAAPAARDRQLQSGRAVAIASGVVRAARLGAVAGAVVHREGRGDAGDPRRMRTDLSDAEHGRARSQRIAHCALAAV